MCFNVIANVFFENFVDFTIVAIFAALELAEPLDNA